MLPFKPACDPTPAIDRLQWILEFIITSCASVQQTLTDTLIPNLPIMVLNNFHADFLAADELLAKRWIKNKWPRLSSRSHR
jgi:hypothetical protein